jgi:hypothetical protein
MSLQSELETYLKEDDTDEQSRSDNVSSAENLNMHNSFFPSHRSQFGDLGSGFSCSFSESSSRVLDEEILESSENIEAGKNKGIRVRRITIESSERVSCVELCSRGIRAHAAIVRMEGMVITM